MYYTVNMSAMNYFGTEIPEIQKVDDQMQIKSSDFYGKDPTDPEVQFTVSDILLSENPDSDCKRFTGRIMRMKKY